MGIRRTKRIDWRLVFAYIVVIGAVLLAVVVAWWLR
jgi:hypothetical protein